MKECRFILRTLKTTVRKMLLYVRLKKHSMTIEMYEVLLHCRISFGIMNAVLA